MTKIKDADELYYVRHSSDPKFDMEKVDAWDQVVFLVLANNLHSIRLKVIDVDRKDLWDKIKEVVLSLIEALIGKVTEGVQEPDVAAKPTATAAEQLQPWLLEKLAAKDNVLFRKTRPVEVSDSLVLQGDG